MPLGLSLGWDCSWVEDCHTSLSCEKPWLQWSLVSQKDKGKGACVYFFFPLSLFEQDPTAVTCSKWEVSNINVQRWCCVAFQAMWNELFSASVLLSRTLILRTQPPGCDGAPAAHMGSIWSMWEERRLSPNQLPASTTRPVTKPALE